MVKAQVLLTFEGLCVFIQAVIEKAFDQITMLLTSEWLVTDVEIGGGEFLLQSVVPGAQVC